MYLLIFWMTLTTFWPCLFHISAISFDNLAAFHDTLAVSHHILACSHAPSPAVSLYRMPWSCYIRRSTPFNYLGGDYGVSWFCQVLCFGWAETSVFLASMLCFHFMLPRAAFVITLPVFAIAWDGWSLWWASMTFHFLASFENYFNNTEKSAFNVLAHWLDLSLS